MRPDYFSVIVLLGVFILIAVRQVGSIRLQIWQIMLLGALTVLLTGSITFADAISAVNLDVMLFLFGMFVVGEALVESRYLYHISYGLFKGARSTDSLVLLVLFVMGFFSAFLMNDTIAIIGTPLVLFFAEKHKISHKLLLLSLCFAVTMGSVASPIGNPQNLLIAINAGIPNPFVTFLKYLMLPTVINLFLAYLVLKFFYQKDFHKTPLDNSRERVADKKLADLSRVSLILIAVMVTLKIAAVSLNAGFDFRLTYIALVPALPILLFSPKRGKILKHIDWHTLIFFASLFIFMEGIWRSGVIQSLIAGTGVDVSSVNLILAVSVLLSQLLSNVPFVALYLPVLHTLAPSSKGMMALAAGSTIAGNLLILGAASNIIVIQNAEKRGHTLTFFEFARVGFPLTIINIIVYRVFLEIIG